MPYDCDKGLRRFINALYCAQVNHSDVTTWHVDAVCQYQLYVLYVANRLGTGRDEDENTTAPANTPVNSKVDNTVVIVQGDG